MTVQGFIESKACVIFKMVYTEKKNRLENNYGENNSEKHWEIYEIFRKIIKRDLALDRTPGPRCMALSGRR